MEFTLERIKVGQSSDHIGLPMEPKVPAAQGAHSEKTSF